VTLRAMVSICFAGLLALIEPGCGGGTHPGPPPPALSNSTTSLADGMVTFPYSQTILATGGVAPFIWSVTSGSLPHNVTLTSSSVSSVTISGNPDTSQTATFTIQVKDSKNQNAAQAYTINIASTGLVQLQAVPGQVPAGMAEIQGVAAGSFNPNYWQGNTLNWVADVRMPMLAPLPGPFQNIYSPWALEQPNGWILFYGGWDGTSTGNDRVYKIPTPDFLSFGTRTLVIDHGAFLHVNNVNVTQLPDGSMHMICTTLVDPALTDKPAYFSSPDGFTWNGTPEPYSAQLSDVVSIPDDPNYAATDYNGGNVLLWENGSWTLYYSHGISASGSVSRAIGTTPPLFHHTGKVLTTSHYANDVRKFDVGGRSWYLMLLYIEELQLGQVPSPVFSYSLSNDGINFGAEQQLFAGAFPQDHYITTPALLTRAGTVLGVLYGANPVDVLDPENQIYARWLQKKVVIQDSSGTQFLLQGGYGPDRQWFQAPASGSRQGVIWVYAEDGITPLASGPASLSAGNAYQLVFGGD
jgi:hypothetical protein